MPRRTIDSVIRSPNLGFALYLPITLWTWTADHSPSLRGVGISRALSSAAIKRSELAPVACMAVIVGRSSARLWLAFWLLN